MSATDIPRIHHLSEQLVNQIAAGEVVDRPASVVRELIDNALDAAASDIRIAIVDAGCGLIHVRDNGQGIHPEDLSLALHRNATSKLDTIQDLEHIASLGFRGEALASIASVSRFRITSRIGAAQYGWCLDSQSGHVRPVAHPPGTTVEVRNLFHNTPARRKFLKSPRTEWLHIQQLVRGMALGHCNTRFQLLHEGRQTLHCASASAAQRAMDLLGPAFVRQGLAIEATHEGMQLSGWVGHPAEARSQTDRQFLHVNGRLVRARLMTHAVHQAFSGRLPPGRHACYLLHLDLDPGLVDVNVHPNKQEVKFRHQQAVHDLLFGALAERLTQTLPDSNDAGQTPATLAPRPVPVLQARDVTRVESWREQQGRLDTNDDAQWLLLPGDRFALWLQARATYLFDVPRAWHCLLEQALLSQWHSGQGARRRLSVPLYLELTAREASLLEANQPLLERLGVVLRLTSPSQVALDAFPECLARANSAELVRDCLDWLRRCQDPEPDHAALCHQLASRGASPATSVQALCALARLWHDHSQQLTRPRPWRLLGEQDWSALLGGSRK